MMAGIGLVALYGYPALLNSQEEANIRNMERNMISLQSDVNALVYKSVPYKETTMQVSGGVLSVKKPDKASSYFSISVDSELLIDESLFTEGKFPPGELHFLSDSGDRSIGLENGAVVYEQSGGSVMLSEPRWFIASDPTGTKTLIITLVQVDIDSSASVTATSGISTVQMSIEPKPIDGVSNSNIIAKSVDPNNDVIYIEIYRENKYYTAWKNYFEYTLNMELEPASISKFKIDGIDQVIIRAWKITILNL
jgi:hypothetical protein